MSGKRVPPSSPRSVAHAVGKAGRWPRWRQQWSQPGGCEAWLWRQKGAGEIPSVRGAGGSPPHPLSEGCGGGDLSEGCGEIPPPASPQRGLQKALLSKGCGGLSSARGAGSAGKRVELLVALQ